MEQQTSASAFESGWLFDDYDAPVHNSWLFRSLLTRVGKTSYELGEGSLTSTRGMKPRFNQFKCSGLSALAEEKLTSKVV
jgi:hypothetical protein